MIIGLVATLIFLKSDPYEGFRARYIPFAREMLASFDAAELEERGYDMTSLLYPIRERIIAKLSPKRSFGKFEASNVRLSVHFGKSTWLVDQQGILLHNGVSSTLATADFMELREIILQRIPSVGMEREEVERVPGKKSPPR